MSVSCGAGHLILSVGVLDHSFIIPRCLCLVAMADLADEIARIAPYANTNSDGEYTGDIYADDEHIDQ